MYCTVRFGRHSCAVEARLCGVSAEALQGGAVFLLQDAHFILPSQKSVSRPARQAGLIAAGRRRVWGVVLGGGGRRGFPGALEVSQR